MPDIQEEFETWQVKTGRTDPIWFGAASFDDRKREYVLDQINRDWIVWQASRAALKVELPDNSARAGSDPYQDGYYACREEVEEALQQAGIEVKYG